MYISMGRREVLATSGLLISGIAGCARSSQNSPPTLTIPVLNVHNRDDIPHDVDILLLHDQEPIFMESVEVEAAKYEDGWPIVVGGKVWRDVATEKQKYTLHARIDKTDWFSTRFDEFGEECTWLTIEISQQGEGVFTFSACGQMELGSYSK